MPALPPYIPAQDVNLATWADNFSDLITAGPATYGLLAGDATAIAAVVTPFLSAYSLAVNPSTRTPVTIADKDDAKIAMLALVRQYAVQISLNAGVLTADKIAVGVNPRTSTPTPIATPTTSPVVTIVSAPPLQHILRYRDEMSSPTVKAKPYGVTQILIYATASATPITDQNALDFKGAYTKAPSLIEWQPEDAGKQAYYAGRWMTRAGKVGPWSSVTNFTIANG
jgi:hypothetical protein